MTPSPEEVRAELERVLTAETFANAGRLSRLLPYLVERTLAGEGDQLKEYVLGVEVFDRSDSFDPRLDSIVRVEARRLRAKLEEYYQGPGAADPIVIAIPRGSYATTFTTPHRLLDLVPAPSTPTAAPALQTANSGRRTSKLQWLAITGFVAAILTIVLIAATRSRPDPTSTAQASSGPSIAVLPFQHYSTNEADALLAARLTDGVTAELARIGTVAVASRTSASQYTGEVRSVREIATALNVDFVMEASAIVETDKLRVVVRLVDGVLDRKVWVGEYDSSPQAIADLSRQIAAEAAAGALKYSSRR